MTMQGLRLGDVRKNAVVWHPSHGLGVVYACSPKVTRVLFARYNTDRIPFVGGRLVVFGPQERITAWGRE